MNERFPVVMTFVLGLSCSGLIAPAPSLFAASVSDNGPRPNIVLIMTDDQGWGDLRCHGNDMIQTPNLDALAEQSVQFDRFFVSPVCAPTRASLLTGRFDVRTGVSGVTNRLEVMRAEEVTMGEVFRAAGYRTACIGKWHNGEQFPNHPTGQGFEHFFGFCGGHWNNYFDTTLEDNGRRVKTSGYITDILTDAAIDFVTPSSDKPFLCYVPYNAPHTPWQVPDKWFDQYAGKGLDAATQSAYAMVTNIDYNVGRLLKAIEQQRSRTIVLFLTDNGPNGNRYNGNMRGVKGSVHEGGVRVPLFVSWPGTLPPKRVEQIAAHVDLLPTLAELCGVKLPVADNRPLDGRSLVPLLKGSVTEDQWPDRMIYTHRSRGTSTPFGAVRTQQYRFVRERQDQLYDMVADPDQKTDISQTKPDVFRRLQAAFDRYVQETNASIAKIEPIPVGFPESPQVELPAVEAMLSPGVRFFEGHGWAHDWAVDFDQQGDELSWPLKVHTPGSYRLILRYACDSSGVGAKLQVEAGEQSGKVIVSDEFNSPLRDRSERSDSKGLRSVRDFADLEAGTYHLNAGDVSLTLRHQSDRSQPLEIDSASLVKVSDDR